MARESELIGMIVKLLAAGGNHLPKLLVEEAKALIALPPTLGVVADVDKPKPPSSPQGFVPSEWVKVPDHFGGVAIVLGRANASFWHIRNEAGQRHSVPAWVMQIQEVYPAPCPAPLHGEGSEKEVLEPREPSRRESPQPGEGAAPRRRREWERKEPAPEVAGQKRGFASGKQQGKDSPMVVTVADEVLKPELLLTDAERQAMRLNPDEETLLNDIMDRRRASNLKIAFKQAQRQAARMGMSVENWLKTQRGIEVDNAAAYLQQIGVAV